MPGARKWEETIHKGLSFPERPGCNAEALEEILLGITEHMIWTSLNQKKECIT